MEILGTARKSFSLTQRPAQRYTTTFRADRSEVEVFEPYEENLPLEAGFYTFVLDEEGRFRVRRGNTSSHASFVRCGPVGAAGNFRINRAGNVAEVFCLSEDYRIIVPNERHPTVNFAIASFLNHHAFEVSPHAVFRFRGGSFETFYVTVDRQRIESPTEYLRLLEIEGQGNEVAIPYTLDEAAAFAAYRPTRPPRLFGMHQDQAILGLESDADASFEFGPPGPPLDPERPRPTVGKRAFILDHAGWLVVGNGHHLLAGGQPVGAAGQIVIESSGIVSELNLNFSGHYRPPLTAEYARYTYRELARHPLLTLSPDCRISGRRFDGLNALSKAFRIEVEELRADDAALDEMIEYAMS